MPIWPSAVSIRQKNSIFINNHFPMPLNILQTIINTQNINSHLFWDNLIKMGSSLRFHFHQANINVLDEVKNGEGAE